MPRRGKNAGLDRVETLAKSERWLAETLELEPPVDGTVADANDVGDLDAGMVRDVARLRALESPSHAPGRPWVWARRVVSARRTIATFEEVTRLGAWACEPGRFLSGVARVGARVAELRGHLMVFVVEDEAVAAHLSRIVRAPDRTEKRAACEHWSHDRLAIERRLDRDFERRAAASRRVLVEGGRAQLARVCALEAAMGTKPAPAAERVDGLVTELHERIVAMRCMLEPSSARAQRVARLERAMAGWGAERRARTPSPTCPSPDVESPGAVAILVSELDVLRVAAAEAVLSSATRARAAELLTSVRHVQIDVCGARYLTASRAVAVAQAAMALVRESIRERVAIESVIGPRALSALDTLVRALPAWSEALMGEMEPRGTHASPGRKATPALAAEVIAILGAGREAMPVGAMVDVVEYGSASDREGRVRQLRDAGRAMLRRRRRAGLEARGRVGRPPGQ
jgi:hypothetical protein